MLQRHIFVSTGFNNSKLTTNELLMKKLALLCLVFSCKTLDYQADDDVHLPDVVKIPAEEHVSKELLTNQFL